MEVKERRPYCSLSKNRRDKEGPYAGEAAPTLSRLFCCLSITSLPPADAEHANYHV